MSVNIKKLKNDGRIREIITYQGEVIKVYEPTKQVIEEVFRLQEEFMSEDDISKVEVSGLQMLELFKKLTDIEGLEDCTEEELQAIIEDPTPAFLMVQNVMEGIITEIYKMVILSAKNRIMEQDFNVKASGVMNDMFGYATAYASQSKEYAEKMAKIDKSTQELAKAKANQKVVPIQKKEEQIGSKGQIQSLKTRQDQKAILAEFDNEFSNKDETLNP